MKRPIITKADPDEPPKLRHAAPPAFDDGDPNLVAVRAPPAKVLASWLPFSVLRRKAPTPKRRASRRR